MIGDYKFVKMWERAWDCDLNPGDKVCGECIRCLKEWQEMARAKFELYKDALKETEWVNGNDQFPAYCAHCNEEYPFGPKSSIPKHDKDCDIFTEDGEVK